MTPAAASCPNEVQPRRPFLGSAVPVVAKTEFASSGFTQAHLAGVRHVGWRLPSNLAVEVRRLLAAGEPFVYAYYDGIDKIAHEYGLGEHYDAEVAAADRLVADVAAVLPPGAALLVTADHGQVEVPEVLALERRGHVLHPPAVRRRPLPLAARPPRGGASPAGRRDRGHAGPGLGRARGAGARRGLARPVGEQRRPGLASATWPSWPGTR